MADILDSLIETAKTAYGARLKSMILYGSKASGEDTKKHSDHNVLIILDTVMFDDMKALCPVMKQWMKAGNRPPLLFTEEYFKNSADVFPIEFIDMKEKHRILYGSDGALKDLVIERTHLRHECEFELKSKLLKLRQGYMMSLGKPERVRELLLGSVSSILVLFRHVLQLLGTTPPADRLEALSALSVATGIQASPYTTVIAMKNGDKQALKQDPEPLMREYLSGLEKIVEKVDTLNV